MKKTKEQVFEKHYDRISKLSPHKTWLNFDRVLDMPEGKITLNAMDDYAKITMRFKSKLKKVLNNVTNPDYDFLTAFDELKEFKEKYNNFL